MTNKKKTKDHRDSPPEESEKSSSTPTKKEVSDELHVESSETILTLEIKAKEYQEMLQRLLAEFENYKKRIIKEREELTKYANFDVLKSLLPIIDNFERALSMDSKNSTGTELVSFLQGFKMIHQDLLDILTKNHLKEIPCIGENVDANLHQIVQVEEKEGVEGEKIIEVFQKGYLLHDRVLRLAMVKTIKSKS